MTSPPPATTEATSASSLSFSSTNTSLGVIEHPLMKVPYESLNRAFRTSQKLIEKEMANVVTNYTDLVKKSTTSAGLSGTAAVSGIDGIIARLHKLKRKLAEDLLAQEEQCIQRTKARLDHLQQYQNAKLYGAPETLLIWNKTRLDRVIIDHLLREGHFETANKFAADSNITDLVDIDVFVEGKTIEEALKKKDCSIALNWCNSNKARLKKMESSLEFNLRCQEFIELLRNNKRIEGIQYARKYLSAFSDTNMKDIQAVMGCIAFSADTNCAAYKNYFSESRWDDLIKQFHHDNYLLHSLTTQSLLSVTLQAGLSSLKTPMCYQNDNKNPNCPVCNTLINPIAENLPFSHRTQSCIVCRISGEVMNEHNLPMALPNGHVYSYKALAEMAQYNNGVITCPKTKQQYTMSDLKKVFVM